MVLSREGGPKTSYRPQVEIKKEKLLKSDCLEMEESREEGEKPVKIVGFERFDCYTIKGEKLRGKEIVEKAAEVLPEEGRWRNVARIEYKDELYPLDPEVCGRGGYTRASYNSDRKSITFYKTPYHEKLDYIEFLPEVLVHEWVHSIDPQVTMQEDLSFSEHDKMIKEWRRIRREEPPFSSYVKMIHNNKDIPSDIKDIVESREDFAESVMHIINNPEAAESNCPKRYEFCVSWLKERFEDFDARKVYKKRRYLYFPYDLDISPH